ncbi:MAG: VCBS repeat-containing protein [Saprospiraceae bacterium]|nr:VCBS repeat-containing protein [Saprospiraceae bacterium]
MNKNNIFILLFLFIFIAACKEKKTATTNNENSNQQIFKRLTASETGITFSNNIVEDDEENVMIYDGFYVGAGAAVLDVNNDGLLDAFFVSNQGPDKLYLNKGKMKFEDISKSAKIEGGEEWGVGATVVDINADGWDDVYVSCKHFLDPEKRRNKLYINNQDNTFTESAKAYGIDDSGFSVQGSFFDYDLDGDLDLYVVNQPPDHNKTRDALLATNKPDYQYTDRLYRNNGNNTFTDVTKQSGIENFAFGLSAAIGDFFNDGFPDIYVSNDYEGGDFLYVNNGNGTFTNVINQSMKHISNFSMGSDVADINNDGWLDIFTADMTPEDHFRNKTNMAGMDATKFWRLVNAGQNYQYMFNSMQLNQGNGAFSEIGLMAGVAKTDWSWSAFFSDFNQDGNKDLYITNGILHDIRNRDFLAYAIPAYYAKKSFAEIIEKSPSVPLKNYMYQNEGNLHFKNSTDDWGLNDKSFSHGAAYGDLDNDGDLDMIVNNMNQEAFVYHNQSMENKIGNYIAVKLIGSNKNPKSFGARVMIAYEGKKIQIGECTNTRGFLSTSQTDLHFGFGNVQAIDSIFIRWQDGKYMRIDNPKINTTIQAKQSDAKEYMKEQFFQEIPFVLTQDVTDKVVANCSHKENEFDDYKREILIPYKQSTLGPALESGDLDGDKLDDIFIGASIGQSPQLLLQSKDGKFEKRNSGPWEKQRDLETTDVLFFDADSDGDLDIYVTSGSNEHAINSPKYADHLYINDGKATFSDGSSKLPKLYFSKSTVRAADFDGDKDLDLFVGGRLVPGKYALSERSAILINNKGIYEDRTKEICGEMIEPYGCVTDATWADLDRDEDMDLVVCGEWMPVSVYENKGGKLNNVSKEYGTADILGWWTSLKVKDINNDNQPDIIAGNIGMNTKFKASTEKPIYVYAKDFDGNGTWDTYLASKGKEGKILPVRGKQCSSEQLPYIKTKFDTYEKFANASVEEILDGMMENSVQKSVTELHSLVFLSAGGQKQYSINYLPNEAQISPIYSMDTYDINKDGIEDLVLGGNYHNREVETSRSDASVGQFLLNNGQGNFAAIYNSISGLKLSNDLRELRIVKNSNNASVLIAANNNAPLQAFLLK